MNGNAFDLCPHDVDFLRTAYLSMIAASHGPDNVPFVARALGCRLSHDHRRVSVFFTRSEARELLAQVSSNGAIAAVFSVPATHEALQLKGSDAAVEAIDAADIEIVNRYCDAFIEHLGSLGYPVDVLRYLLVFDPSDLAAVIFTPAAAFSQTPGPRAGRRSE